MLRSILISVVISGLFACGGSNKKDVANTAVAEETAAADNMCQSDDKSNTDVKDVVEDGCASEGYPPDDWDK